MCPDKQGFYPGMFVAEMFTRLSQMVLMYTTLYNTISSPTKLHLYVGTEWNYIKSKAISLLYILDCFY